MFSLFFLPRIFSVRLKVEKMTQDIEKYNKVFRKKLVKLEAEKMHKYTEARNSQINEWRAKTAHSPYRLDQNEVHRLHFEGFFANEKEKKNRHMLNTKMKSLTGLPKNDICPRDLAKKIKNPSDRLAMEYRATKLQNIATQKDIDVLNDVIDHECDAIIRRFPQIGMRMAFGPSVSSQPSLISEENSSQLTSDSFLSDSIRNATLGKRRYDAETVRQMKEKDSRIYSADGRYDEFGNFITTENLKTTTGMLSAKYAQVSGRVVENMDDFERHQRMSRRR